MRRKKNRGAHEFIVRKLTKGESRIGTRVDKMLEKTKNRGLTVDGLETHAEKRKIGEEDKRVAEH